MAINQEILNKFKAASVFDDYDYDRITGQEKIDVQEMLARQKINTLWSSFVLETENEQLKEIFDNIKKNNNLSLFFKSGERELSKKGKNYIAFDIFSKKEWEGEEAIILYNAYPSFRNQTMRINQQQEYAGVITLDITSNQQGQGIRVEQTRTANETKQLMLKNAIPEKEITLGNFNIATPNFLKNYLYNGTRTHNYKVLSMKEMLNKNISDFNGEQDYLLPDDAPVSHLRDMINSMLVFYKKEQVKNSTKWIGKFGSYQEILKPKANLQAQRFLHLQQQGKVNQNILNDLQDFDRARTILEDDYLISTNQADFQADKIQSTFDGEAIARALTSLLEIYFNGAGLDWSLQGMSGQTQYINDSNIVTQNRRTIETIKETIILREEQFKSFFNAIIDAWFSQKNKHIEFEGEWEFRINSNIVTEEQFNIERITLMKENNWISDDIAINKLNKEMSSIELKKMKIDIEKEKAEKEKAEKELIEKSFNGGSDE